MKKKSFILLVVAAMASCTQSDILLRSDEQVEIRLRSSALSVEGVTRAPFDGQISSGNKLKARVAATSTSGTYTTNSLYVDGTMTFSDVNAETQFDEGVSGKKYYPADGSDLYLFGLYPATGWTLTTQGDINFTGKEDVMVAKAVQWNKAKAQAASDNLPKLEFKHLLTKLNIKLQAEDADAIAAWGQISKIELLSVKNSVPYSKVGVNITAGTAESNVFSVGQSPFKCFGLTEVDNAGAKVKTYTENEYASQTYTLTTTATYQAYSLIAPVDLTATTGDLKFKVYAAGAKDGAQEVVVELKTVEGTDFTGYTQGKAFDINLKFKATTIVGAASVTDWAQAGSSDTEIQ